MASETNRVLRIGVVYKGQILAERVMDRRQPVRVGTRADCTVQIAAKDHPNFPEYIELAVLHKGKYHLILPTDSSIAVNLRGGSGGDGISAGDVVKVKGRKSVPIENYTGGSVAFGEAILMFQFVRGDAVPTVTHEETVLRIGLVHDSRLLSDKIFHLGQTVSIGASKADTLVLDSEDYSGPSAIFSTGKDGRVDVKLPAKSGLRLAADGAALSEEEAIRKGIARRTPDGIELSMGLRSRGRASLGPYTLLFQVIRRTVTVPQMPRATVFGQMAAPLMNDPVWSISFAVSFLLIGSIVAQAVIFQSTTGKYLKQQRLEEYLSHETYEVIIEEKEEPEEKPTAEIKSEAAKKEEKKELKKEKKKKVEKPQPTAEKQVDPEERKRNARKIVAKRTIAGAFMDKGGMASKLFAAGDEGDGSVVASTFGGAGDDPANGPGGGLTIEGGGGGGTIENVATGRKGFGKRDSASTKVKAKKKEKRISISLSAGSLGGSGAGKSGVAKVIRRKNSAVRRCYEAALRNNPSLSGKVSVQFTVGTAGTVTRVNVIGAAGQFATCIKSKFTRIRGLPLLTSPQSFSQSYVFTKS
jgi:outer membrane biosynthesis protein TonB